MPSILEAVRDGARRVNAAPAVLLGVWVVTIAATIPAALVLRAEIAAHLGDSLAADTAAEGVNYEWMQEFEAQTRGIASTFRPTIIGFGAVLDNLAAFMDDTARPLPIVAIAVTYMTVWLFLAGGIIDRYARARTTRADGFFGACGVYFFRFLRLAVVQWAVYAILFAVLHPLLFDRVLTGPTRDVAMERTPAAGRFALYIVFGVLAGGVNLIFDYAKVRAVVEDRRSMVGALAAAIGFVKRNAAVAAGLYAVDAFIFLAVTVVYGAAAPSVGRGPLVWIVVALAQVYVAARLWVKLLFWASETALFQLRLAHAGYVARPEAVWPDSPVAEGLL